MGKLSELKVSEVPMGVDVIDNQEKEAQQPISTGRSRHCEQDASGVLSEFNERAFNFIPLETYFSDDSQPGPSCRSGDGDSVSDRDVDEHVEEDSSPTAGHIIRMDRTLHEKWRAHFGYEDADGDTAMDDGATSEQVFAPFASELDWRVASWAVQEGMGQKTLDKLFAIPGVGITSSSVFFPTIILTWTCLLCRWWSASAYLTIILESFIRSLTTSLHMLNGKLDLYGSGRILM